MILDSCDQAVASSSSLRLAEDSPKLLESYRSDGRTASSQDPVLIPLDCSNDFDSRGQAVASSSSLRLTEDSSKFLGSYRSDDHTASSQYQDTGQISLD